MSTSINITRSADGAVTESQPDAPSSSQPAGLSTKVVGKGTSMNIGQAGAITSKQHSVASASTGDVVTDKMAAKPGSVLASARSPSTGRALSNDELTPSSLVTIEGIQTSVAAAMAMGVLDKDELGRYADTGTPAVNEDDASASDPAEASHPLPAVVNTIMQSAASGLPEFVGEQTLFNAMLGKDINYDQLAGRCDRDADTIEQDMETAVDGVVTHLTSTLHLDADTLADVLTEAEQANSGTFSQAVRQMVTEGKSDAMIRLVVNGMAQRPPSAEQLQDRGFETKAGADGETMVQITEGGESYWLSAAVARKLGLA